MAPGLHCMLLPHGWLKIVVLLFQVESQFFFISYHSQNIPGLPSSIYSSDVQKIKSEERKISSNITALLRHTWPPRNPTYSWADSVSKRSVLKKSDDWQKQTIYFRANNCICSEIDCLRQTWMDQRSHAHTKHAHTQTHTRNEHTHTNTHTYTPSYGLKTYN